MHEPRCETLNKYTERGHAIYDAVEFDVDKTQQWTRGVRALLDGNLKPEIIRQFPSEYITGNNMLSDSLAALQKIATSIRVDDLRR
jgi:hypothetical protein